MKGSNVVVMIVTIIIIIFVSQVYSQPNKTRYATFTWDAPLLTESGDPITKELSYDLYIGRLKGNKPPSYYKHGSTKTSAFHNIVLGKGCFSSYVVAYYTDTPNENRSKGSKAGVFCVGIN